MAEAEKKSDIIKPAGKQNFVDLTVPVSKKPMIAVHDKDLDLGYQLHVADAKNLGRDQTVVKELSSSVNIPGAGKGGVSGGPASGNNGPHYGAATNSGDNSGMHSSGTSSQTGVPTSTGEGGRHTGSAGTESDSANENKQ
ncbi:MAG TPA: hypothetical protein VH186_28775 [Chloroflexia bacterium]|nr:hypothetical protein [Chloroflexia bacterium]